MTKIVPKSIQTCFEHVLGQTFRIFFAQFSMECRVFEKFQKKNFQNSKKSQKCSRKYPNVFYDDFFEKNFKPGVPGGSSFRKFSIFFFKIPKMPKIVPKSIQTCFERVLGQTFRNFFAQFSVEGRVFENFEKKNIFKSPKKPKSVPKSIQTCFEHVLGKIFEKILPSFPWRVKSSKIFLKIKNFSKFKIAQNRSQKYPNMF